MIRGKEGPKTDRQHQVLHLHCTIFIDKPPACEHFTSMATFPSATHTTKVTKPVTIGPFTARYLTAVSPVQSKRAVQQGAGHHLRSGFIWRFAQHGLKRLAAAKDMLQGSCRHAFQAGHQRVGGCFSQEALSAHDRDERCYEPVCNGILRPPPCQ